MSAYQLPQLTDTSWRGEADYLINLAVNGPPELRDHFKAELAVIQPTLRALGIDVQLPPELQIKTVLLAPPVLYVESHDQTPPPVKLVTTGGGTVNLFSKEPQVGPLSEADSWAMADQVARQLMKDFGFTRAQAAGIVGNLFHESVGMNANVNEFNWRYPEGDPRNYGQPFDNVYGYGWAQWSADRKTAYVEFCKENGLNAASPYANYAFLVHELKTSESGTVPAVLATTTVDDAAVVFRKVFERAAMPVDSSRVAAANTIFAGLS
jgi:hypothetical protein